MSVESAVLYIYTHIYVNICDMYLLRRCFGWICNYIIYILYEMYLIFLHMFAYLFIYLSYRYILNDKYQMVCDIKPAFPVNIPIFPIFADSRSGEAISWKSVVNPCI